MCGRLCALHLMPFMHVRPHAHAALRAHSSRTFHHTQWPEGCLGCVWLLTGHCSSTRLWLWSGNQYAWLECNQYVPAAVAATDCAILLQLPESTTLDLPCCAHLKLLNLPL
jgi:hypothetical protein